MNFNRVLFRSRFLTKASSFLKGKRELCYLQGLNLVNGFLRSNKTEELTYLMDILYDSNMSYSQQIRKFKLSVVSSKEEKVVAAPVFPESITEGDVRFHKKVGDSVRADEVVCDIETDKTVIPVPSPVNGVIVELYAEDMGTVKSAQKLFKINIGPVGTPPSHKPTSKSKESPPQQASPTRPKTPEPGPSIAKPLSPKPPSVGSAAQEKPPYSHSGIPRIPPQSLSAAYIKLPPEKPTKEITGTRSEHKAKMSRIRQRIAQRLKDAQNTCAMLTTFNEVDMSHIKNFQKTHREAFSKKHGVKLGFMSAFLRASVYALQDQPIVNAVIVGNDIIYRDYIDISVAVASPRGLLVPVIRNVEKMNYADIEKEINELGVKAKQGQITVEDMDGGTFTVSNGGVFGSMMGTPIINPPQSSILGMHGIFDRPVALDNQVVIRPMMYLALTYDHRLIDGREAVLFLRKIKAAIENPMIIITGL